MNGYGVKVRFSGSEEIALLPSTVTVVLLDIIRPLSASDIEDVYLVKGDSTARVWVRGVCIPFNSTPMTLGDVTTEEVAVNVRGRWEAIRVDTSPYGRRSKKVFS